MLTVIPWLAFEDRVAAIASIAETLARLHATGVTHRDIKPDNLAAKPRFCGILTVRTVRQ